MNNINDQYINVNSKLFFSWIEIDRIDKRKNIDFNPEPFFLIKPLKYGSFTKQKRRAFVVHVMASPNTSSLAHARDGFAQGHQIKDLYPSPKVMSTPKYKRSLYGIKCRTSKAEPWNKENLYLQNAKSDSLSSTNRAHLQKEKKDFPSKNILQIVNKIEKTIKQKQLIDSSNNILLMISGGQDSIFLLFCLSFLQSQIAFKAKIIWCNHFWQMSSFYTTVHLTKSSVAFSSSIVGFLPFQVNASLPSFWCCKEKKNLRYPDLKGGGLKALSYPPKTELFIEKPLKSKAFVFLLKKISFSPFYYKKALPFFFTQICSSVLTRKELKKITKVRLSNTVIIKYKKNRAFDFLDRIQIFYLLAYKRSLFAYISLLKKRPLYITNCMFTDTSFLFYKSSILNGSALQFGNLRSIAFRERLHIRPSLLVYKVRKNKQRKDLRTYMLHMQSIQSTALQLVGTLSSFRLTNVYPTKHNETVYKRLQIEDCFAKLYRCKKIEAELTKDESYVQKYYYIKHLLKAISRFEKSDSLRSRKRKAKGYKKFVEERSETGARNWRHITTERASTFYNSDRCIYGHTASDRIETILFNLIRGSGNRGTQSLPWKRRYSNFCYNNFYPLLEQFIDNTHICV